MNLLQNVGMNKSCVRLIRGKKHDFIYLVFNTTTLQDCFMSGAKG